MRVRRVASVVKVRTVPPWVPPCNSPGPTDSYDQYVRHAIAIAFVLFATVLAGCGGSDAPTGKIATAAKDYYEASDASCAKEGIMVFVGEREDVYGCLLEEVPPQNRPISQIESSSIHACYVYSNDEVFEVTAKLQDLVDAQEASGTSPDEFSCVSVSDN